MHCLKCGTELPEGAKFCSNCGEKVDESAIPFLPSETWGSRCRKKAIDFWSRRDSFTKVVIIGMSICSPICMISFLAGKTFAAVCALLQICLFVSAYYFGLLRMGMEASGPGTTREDYDGYIAACTEKGFDMLVAREKDSYCVDSEDDYRLVIDYIGEENAMVITIKAVPFPVEIELKCTANLLFSKYDMEVFIDGNKTGALAHGGSDIFKAELEGELIIWSLQRKGALLSQGR